MKYYDAREIDGRRRRLLRWVAAAPAAIAVGSLSWAQCVGAASSKIVRLVVFDGDGQRLGERRLAMVVKTAAAWRRQLSPLAYWVTRQQGTERAFSGHYYDKPDKAGFYRCICCDNALYDASAQFHSGTGWPSFWEPIAAENITEHLDRSFGMTRTEIQCTRCAAHLGHKFHDGPAPTGLRYCIDSVALDFVPTEPA